MVSLGIVIVIVVIAVLLGAVGGFFWRVNICKII